MLDKARLRILGAAAAAAAVVLAAIALPVRSWIESVLAFAAGRGAWSGVVLALVWVPAAVLLVPGALLTLGTGFLLGVGWGTVVVSVGSTAGAVAAFGVGRWLARDWARRRIAGRARVEAIDRAVAEEGLKVVLLTRLSPVFPYNALNYAYALTGVSLRDFLLGSWIGMLPGTLMYAYLGAGAQTLTALATGREARTPVELALYGVGLAATVAVTVLVTRAARRALADRVLEAGT